MATEAGLSISRLPEIKNYDDFPKTKQFLWDKTCIGKAIFLNISHYRKPKICISEKVLQLVQHQCEHFSQFSHRLIGTLVVEDDREGVQFQVDRLDTNPTSPLDISYIAPGDVIIPFEVTNNMAKEHCGSVDSYVKSFNVLQERCCSKRSIELSTFLTLQGSASFYSNAHTSVSHLEIDMITLDTVFKAVPITPIPIVLTALSKNLAGPMSLSHMQGTPKTGYLTMDHTRKLLLVLESDPKTSSLPVVGIWVSGVQFVHHPFVWAACLRYIHNTNLTDRVCLPPDDFLLIIYSPLHSKPEFYQCVTNSGNTNLNFELFSGYEVTNIVKALSSPSEGFTELELRLVDARSKMEVFDAAKAKHRLLLSRGETSCGMVDDIEPRSVPTPHMEKVQKFRPMVPDVSVLWTDAMDLNAPPQPFMQTYSNSSAYQQVPRHFHQSPEAGTMPNMRTPIRAPSTFASIPFPQTLPLSGGYGQYHGSMQVQYSQKTPPTNSSARAFEVTENCSGNTVSVPASTNPYRQPSPTTNNFHRCIPPSRVTEMPTYMCNRAEPIERRPPQNINTQPSASNTKSSISRCIPAQDAPRNSPSCLTANQVLLSQKTPSLNSKPFIKTYYTPNSALKTVVEEVSFSSTGQKMMAENCQNERNTNQSRGYHPANNTNSSGPSDDDSGLSVTPEKTNSSQAKGTSAIVGEKTGQASSSSGHDTATENVKWDQVPADIRALLIQQNDQIRQLQQQIQMLLLQQQSFKLEEQQGGKAISIGNQNNFQYNPNAPQDLKNQSKINQMSPCTNTDTNQMSTLDNQEMSESNKDTTLDSETITESEQTIRRGNQSTTTNNQSTQYNQSKLSSALVMSSQLAISTSTDVTSPKTNDKILTDKARDDASSATNKKLEDSCVPAPTLNITPPKLSSPSNESHLSTEADISQDDLAESMESFPFCEQSVRSTISELAVDMPDYASSYIDRSQLDQSPASVSQCYQNKQDDSFSTLAEDATDPRQYYSQLMNNIQLFLTNSANSDPEPSVHVRQAEASVETTSVNYGDSVNSSLAQQIHYVSMLLGCGSSTDQSVEIRNMAFKYLPEDQLPEIAKLFQQEGNKLCKKKNKSGVLQRAFSPNRTASSTYLSPPWGLSPCNMTIATQRYLAKHGLLGNDASVIAPCSSEQVSLWEVPKLKTDFSILTARGEDSTSLFISRSGIDAHENSSDVTLSSENTKGGRKSVSPLSLTQETDPSNNENWLPSKVKNTVPKDLGASPVLRLPKQNNRNKSNPHYDSNDVTKGYQSRNVLREVKGQGFKDASKQVRRSSTSMEDDNILDIAKLKQLPKLL